MPCGFFRFANGLHVLDLNLILSHFFLFIYRILSFSLFAYLFNRPYFQAFILCVSLTVLAVVAASSKTWSKFTINFDASTEKIYIGLSTIEKQICYVVKGECKTVIKELKEEFNNKAECRASIDSMFPDDTERMEHQICTMNVVRFQIQMILIGTIVALFVAAAAQGVTIKMRWLPVHFRLAAVILVFCSAVLSLVAVILFSSNHSAAVSLYKKDAYDYSPYAKFTGNWGWGAICGAILIAGNAVAFTLVIVGKCFFDNGLSNGYDSTDDENPLLAESVPIQDVSEEDDDDDIDGSEE